MSQDKVTLQGKRWQEQVDNIYHGTPSEREAATNYLLALMDHHAGKTSPQAMRDLITQLVARNPYKTDATRYRHLRTPNRSHHRVGRIVDNTGRAEALYENALDQAVDKSLEENINRHLISADLAEAQEAREAKVLREAERLAQLKRSHPFYHADIPPYFWRHVRTQGVYKEIGRGKMQNTLPIADLTDVVVYRGEDEQLWVRPVSEFKDGRFEPVDGSVLNKPVPPDDAMKLRMFLGQHLPVDVKIGHVTHRAGTTLFGIVQRMKGLYKMATGEHADTIAARSVEERIAFGAKFLAEIVTTPVESAISYPETIVWGANLEPEYVADNYPNRGEAEIMRVGDGRKRQASDGKLLFHGTFTEKP